MPPRLRRIVALDDSDEITSRSLKPDLVAPLKTMSSARRKIVTIAEDDESDLHPKFCKFLSDNYNYSILLYKY